MKKNIAILLYEGVEVLDFAGPFEVFAVASELEDHKLFNVFTIAKSTGPVNAVNGLSVNPKYDFMDHPAIDILIIPGGAGSRLLMQDEDVLGWVRTIHNQSEYTASICSGSRILGTLGLLDNKKYCTHAGVYDHMEKIVPTGIPQRDKRFTKEQDRIFTSGGISAGIDLSFHILENLHGLKIKNNTSSYMEYEIQNSGLGL